MRSDFALYLEEMDLSRRILEIGPLDSPILTRDEADVYYADVRTREEICAVYRDDAAVRKDDIVPIDYVIRDSYAKALGDDPKFDYVLMSHVLEHVPRLIEFFQDIADVLVPDGYFYTFMPDHRYCFDHFRHPTSFAEAYHVHVNGLPFPQWRVLDNYLEMARMETPRFYWREERKGSINLSIPRVTMSEALDIYRLALDKPEQTDNCHFSVFSPQSFLLLLLNLVRAGLFPFRLDTFFPTAKDEFTFGAIFRMVPGMLNDKTLQRAEEKNLVSLYDRMAG